MKMNKRRNEHGYIQVECPVCSEWIFKPSLGRHLALKQDGKHRKFYIENSDIIIKRKLNLKKLI